MNKAKKTDRIILIVLVGIVLLSVFLVWRRRTGDSSSSVSGGAEREVRYQDYNGRTFGILSGTNMDAATQEFFPDSEYLYFDKSGVFLEYQKDFSFTCYNYSAQDGKIRQTYSMTEEKTESVPYKLEGDTLNYNGFEYKKASANELL